MNSQNSNAAIGDADTVSFTAFGSWSKDQDLHVATVQISTAPDEPYVSIQIDGGLTSNVNTRPPELLPAGPVVGPNSSCAGWATIPPVFSSTGQRGTQSKSKSHQAARPPGLR